MYSSSTLYLILFAMFSLSCSTRKNTTIIDPPTPTVDNNQPPGRPEPPYTLGFVINMSGLDGCDKFIISDNGTKFMPLEWPEWAADYPEFTRVQFSYISMEDMMSTCMAQDEIIDLTQIIRYDFEKSRCAEVEDPYKVGWMAPLVHHLNPYRITKYPYQKEYAYYLQCGPRNLLFHCKGYLICEVPGRSFNECARQISETGEGETIWVRNE